MLPSRLLLIAEGKLERAKEENARLDFEIQTTLKHMRKCVSILEAGEKALQEKVAGFKREMVRALLSPPSRCSFIRGGDCVLMPLVCLCPDARREPNELRGKLFSSSKTDSSASSKRVHHHEAPSSPTMSGCGTPTVLLLLLRRASSWLVRAHSQLFMTLGDESRPGILCRRRRRRFSPTSGRSCEQTASLCRSTRPCSRRSPTSTK